MAVVRSSSSSSNARNNALSLKGRRFSVQTLLVASLTAALGFYLGLAVGTVHSTTTSTSTTAGSAIAGDGGVGGCLYGSQQAFDEAVRQKVQKVSAKHVQQMKANGINDDTAKRFPKQVQDFAVGMGRVQRDEFAARFDTGVPLDKTLSTNEQVLILYSQEQAMPDDAYSRSEATSNTELPLMDVNDATANCDFLNVVLTDHSTSRRQCVALFGQYEAFHIQKYMRLPVPDGKLNHSAPLRLVNRGAQASGRKSTKPPTKEITLEYWEILETYLHSLESVLRELEPIAAKVAVNNTIVVLVCNFGQSALLMNFVCNARSKGIDLSAILVFATDEETRELAEGLGVSVFFDETNYGSMPKNAARRYADHTFMRMMMAKLYCVQMISMLGYDILFNDVDAVWFKDPLPYFHNSSNPNTDFDMYFQDDGNHALYYAPYSANTGFYYVRSNERTRYFFNSFLMAGDLIRSTRSHQVPLVALLNEHASMYGLKVKIFSRDGDDFPGGHAFHRRKTFMRDILTGIVKPYIFHMSWTKNKDNKMLFMQQFGEWYLNEQCLDKSASTILGTSYKKGLGSELIQPCCAPEPLFSCHYRDKPSLKKCKDSPAIDKGGRSFW